MHSFLAQNRDELIERCKAKVARRFRRAATAPQLANGIPMFLAQLTRTLQAEIVGNSAESEGISGPSGGDAAALSDIGTTASEHGKQLMELGYSVDEVVHDYGDLCQAITDLALERDAPFSVDQFRTLNRCLDNAIAGAVTEFSRRREASLSSRQAQAESERLRILVHELRNYLHTATLAFAALETGKVPVDGATGGLLRRSLRSASDLLDRSRPEVMAKAAVPPKPAHVSANPSATGASRANPESEQAWCGNDEDLRTAVGNGRLHDPAR